MSEPETLLKALFRAAIASASPAQCLPAHLPIPPAGKLIMLAGGKAAASMAAAAIAHYQRAAPQALSRLTGLAITRRGYACRTTPLELVEAGHPIPDQAGVVATARILALAASARSDDLVLVLLSGGASALWVAPANGLDLPAKQAVTKALLRAGAPIGEINTVRRHLSRIKGGRLARLVAPAPLVTLAISDVPGDDPAAIGSGPTVPDPTTLADARNIVSHYRLDLPASINAALADPANETVKAGEPGLANNRYEIVARPADALAAAASLAANAGYEPIVLGDAIEGEAREVAEAHARMAREIAAAGRRFAILSGGELTVTVGGTGSGGPNQEYALALALCFAGDARFHALAGDTDGTDGGNGLASDPAGALIDGTTVPRSHSLGLDPAAFLAKNDSATFFTAIGASLQTGPTLTNVNDFRAILVDSTKAGAR